jgi:hypothetical protein
VHDLNYCFIFVVYVQLSLMFTILLLCIINHTTCFGLIGQPQVDKLFAYVNCLSAFHTLVFMFGLSLISDIPCLDVKHSSYLFFLCLSDVLLACFFFSSTCHSQKYLFLLVRQHPAWWLAIVVICDTRLREVVLGAVRVLCCYLEFVTCSHLNICFCVSVYYF